MTRALRKILERQDETLDSWTDLYERQVAHLAAAQALLGTKAAPASACGVDVPTRPAMLAVQKDF